MKLSFIITVFFALILILSTEAAPKSSEEISSKSSSVASISSTASPVKKGRKAREAPEKSESGEQKNPSTLKPYDKHEQRKGDLYNP